jgi:hypothetical protein
MRPTSVELEMFDANRESPTAPHARLRPARNRSSPLRVRRAMTMPMIAMAAK